MSMTSAVNPELRRQILNTLASGIFCSNRSLAFRLGYQFSLRSIQEATQKMTKTGLLHRIKSGRYTFYGV
jgi:hypothetical protein